MQPSREYEVLGKKLFSDFNSALDLLSSINTICVVPVYEGKTNLSPVMKHHDCIGLEDWCIKYLFMYSYNRLMLLTKQSWLKDRSDVNNLSRCVVMLCPDCTTAWNMRKVCLSQLVSTSVIMDELHLIKLALKLKPKSTESFAHRKWTLKYLFNNFFPLNQQHDDSDDTTLPKDIAVDGIVDLLKNELIFCTQVADWHACNYTAWSYRVWIVDKFVLPHLCTPCSSESFTSSDLSHQLLQLMMQDLNDVNKWVELHVSDYSGMSYVQFLLQKITSFTLQHRSRSDLPASTAFVNLATLWIFALQLNSDLLWLYDGHHEALWSHRRALTVLLRKHFRNNDNFQEEEKQLMKQFSLQEEEKFCHEFATTFSKDSLVIKYVKNYKKSMERYFSIR